MKKKRRYKVIKLKVSKSVWKCLDKTRISSQRKKKTKSNWSFINWKLWLMQIIEW